MSIVPVLLYDYNPEPHMATESNNKSKHCWEKIGRIEPHVSSVAFLIGTTQGPQAACGSLDMVALAYALLSDTVLSCFMAKKNHSAIFSFVYLKIITP